MKNKPKVLNAATAERVKAYSVVAPSGGQGISLPPKPLSKEEELYELIDTHSLMGYQFTDNEYGFCWIEKSDIEYKGDDLFVIRFRCPTEYAHKVFFGRMSKRVCDILRCDVHFFHDTKWEWYSENNKLPYEDCVWVVQKGEWDRREQQEEEIDWEQENDDFYADLEELPDNWKCESTDEEIEENIQKTMESFV